MVKVFVNVSHFCLSPELRMNQLWVLPNTYMKGPRNYKDETAIFSIDNTAVN